MSQLLEIVNEQDEIIGLESRTKIHREGLRHREIHVYFMTPDHKFIFQRRAKDKDTFPDKLDATVGGHVELGMSYLETAIKETEEETGLIIAAADLITITKISGEAVVDNSTKKINNANKVEYLYIFKGEISDLKIEAGKASGFEIWSQDKLSQASKIVRDEFIPYVFDFVTTKLPTFLEVNNL